MKLKSKEQVVFESHRWSGDRGDPEDGYSTITVSIAGEEILEAVYISNFEKHETSVKEVEKKLRALGATDEHE